jgi:hypothetical protein
VAISGTLAPQAKIHDKRQMVRRNMGEPGSRHIDAERLDGRTAKDVIDPQHRHACRKGTPRPTVKSQAFRSLDDSRL